AVLGQGVRQARVQVPGAVVVAGQAVVVGVEQFKEGVEPIGLHGGRDALPGAAAEPVEIGRSAGIAAGAVRRQPPARFLPDRDGRSWEGARTRYSASCGALTTSRAFRLDPPSSFSAICTKAPFTMRPRRSKASKSSDSRSIFTRSPAEARKA